MMLANMVFSILLHVPFDFLSIVIVVSESVVNLGKRERRESSDEFLRGEAMLKDRGRHRANGKPRSTNNGTAPANRRVAGDMRMHDFGHVGLLV